MADAGKKQAPPTSAKQTTKQGMDYLQYLIRYFKACGLVLPVWLLGYFNFSPSWVLIAMFCYLMSEEYRKIKAAKFKYAKEAVTNEKDAILARTDELPSWVFFPDVERAEWLNKMIKQMWPYIGVYVKNLLKTTVEPAVQNSLPNSLKPFKFETIDLGDLPPRIGGVKVYIENLQRDEIIMDFELFYASDCQIKVAVRGLSAGIKDLTIHGHMRIVMKPLVDTVPIIGGLHVFFLNQPTIDFDLTNTANMLDVPLLSNTVRGIIVDQISYYMVLPNKLPVQLAQNIDVAAFKYPKPAGVVRFNIVAGRELKATDFKVIGKGKSDPYCKVYVGAQTFKTKVIENTVAPVWNAYFEAVVDQNKGQFMDIDVLDEDPGDDDELGCCSIDLESVSSSGNMDSWLPLENVKTGMIHVRALWLHLSKNVNDLDKAMNTIAEQKKSATEATLSTALLMVTLDSAKALPRSKKSMSEPSPFVELTLGNEVKKSNIKPKTTDPLWEENFQFLIHDPNNQELLLKVTDSTKDKKLGTLAVPIKTLLTAPDMIINRPYALDESGPQSKVVMRLCLRVLTSEVPAAWARDDVPVTETKVAEGGTSVDTGHGDIKEEIKTGQVVKDKEEFQKVETVGTKEQAVTEKPAEPVKHSAEATQGDNVSTMSSNTSQEKVGTPGTELRQRCNTKNSTDLQELGSINLTIRYSTQRNCLVCVVHKCCNLPGYDDDNLSDPYVRIYLLPDTKSKRKTQTVKNNLNPEYDETFEWKVSLAEAQTRSLDIMVKNKNSMFSSAKVEMGVVVINLSQLDLKTATTEWFDFQDPDAPPQQIMAKSTSL